MSPVATPPMMTVSASVARVHQRLGVGARCPTVDTSSAGAPFFQHAWQHDDRNPTALPTLSDDDDGTDQPLLGRRALRSQRSPRRRQGRRRMAAVGTRHAPRGKALMSLTTSTCEVAASTFTHRTESARGAPHAESDGEVAGFATQPSTPNPKCDSQAGGYLPAALPGTNPARRRCASRSDAKARR